MEPLLQGQPHRPMTNSFMPGSRWQKTDSRALLGLCLLLAANLQTALVTTRLKAVVSIKWNDTPAGRCPVVVGLYYYPHFTDCEAKAQMFSERLSWM